MALCNRHSCSVGTAKPERSRNEERIHGFGERFFIKTGCVCKEWFELISAHEVKL